MCNRINAECFKKGIKPPAYNTVSLRISKIENKTLVRARDGTDCANKFKSTSIINHESKKVLEQVQMDHTVIDLMIVDDVDLQPIGRPYLTVAIDTYSRCILGMLITLDAPSSTSVGLCLAQVISDKSPWIDSLSLNINWSMGGKPEQIYVDNASEFKSEALQKGCDLHGILLEYRPPGSPHYGGIVERVIGTLMKKVHDLPGTTFSNIHSKGKYQSEKYAVLTLKELERWMVLSIDEYHNSIHGTIKVPPKSKWDDYVGKFGKPNLFMNSVSFVIDFLPIIKRKITRTGFVVDHIHYFSNSLKPYISNRKTEPHFLLRRDPRDISKVWMLDVKNNHYVEVPYSSISNPPISIWEHKSALSKLKAKGASQINESQLFKTVDEMRAIVESASKKTKKMRREVQRQKNNLPTIDETQPDSNIPIIDQNKDNLAHPFNEIEDW